MSKGKESKQGKQRQSKQGNEGKQGKQRQSKQGRSELRSDPRIVPAQLFLCFFAVSDVLSYLCSSLFGLVFACLSIRNVLLKQYVCFSFVCSFKVVVLMLGLFGVCVMKAAKLFLSNHAPCRHLHTSMHPLAAASPLQRQSAKLARSVIR